MDLWVEATRPLKQEMERLRWEVGSLLDRFVSHSSCEEPFWKGTNIIPLVNVSATADSFVITAEIPGVNKEGLDIRIDGDTLTIRGERRSEPISSELSCHRRERAVGHFQRSLELPGTIDAKRVKATYRNGVLTITLFKETQRGARQVSVEPE